MNEFLRRAITADADKWILHAEALETDLIREWILKFFKTPRTPPAP